ncbi:MAG: ribosomal RNA small subunit methyltransferase A [Deltaproteobacteria bacterium RIFCSPLOWO2_12_FULL_40_28]|nr:MAG: ribosomal RNA small subunit methyltransferase A [Deltaproteobacteria bacterium RIFCSPHIGHO2_02_FULL_40_28]OGQ21125.1 MAG: ribosomal RNA small subunit methyltransferase A [Deltaproteobacteria bacterium RIFCSPHIGHO2_12_FULL_40_32]OGQ39042.1 MAG: ribosomal RNA small subunit methyltransferase A [Deltaproteobacteria bacterium RIFCSPLOWO2_02_FULL_40_36]OGQ53090.1 MAG: ribosomal RNA small subunit methyltransferase A [Deltaproteobacteria bacterium RIFCSPLOWO2_12_FULL_40_28]
MNTQNHTPKKSLGQNFLIDGNYQRKIIASVEKIKNKKILEIGPGLGAITSYLSQFCSQLWLVEKDNGLAASLKERFKETNFIHVMHENFLKLDLNFLKDFSPVTVVGNLPYNVGARIFIQLLEQRCLFDHLFLMFQKEVALRFMAKPGTKDYGLLRLWAESYTIPKIIFHLPATAFKPRPRVQSSFVHFTIKEKSSIPDDLSDFFWNIIPRLFQQRRKTLGASLKNILRKNFRDQEWSKKRAEDLNLEQLIELVKTIRQSLT